MDYPIKAKNRIAHYDILRGLAISLMLMANSAASIYTATPPLFMRLVGSFAAPGFMMLAGMMLALAKKPQPIRGFYIIATGGLLDVVVWRIVPFMTFDVLYTIGVAIVLTAYPARLFSIRTLWILGVLLLLAGQGLQWTWGYRHDILDIALPLPDALPSITTILSRVLRQLVIDGWFPLFPWLGFVCLGAALQRSLQAQTGCNSSPDNCCTLPYKGLLCAVIIFVVASVYWTVNFAAPDPRQGYSELFYPPNAGFCFTAASAFCVILFCLQTMLRWPPSRFFLAPFRWMGQRSLWMYVLHLLIIRYLLVPYFVTPALDSFLYTVFILWLSCAFMARMLIAYPFAGQEQR